MVKIPDLRVLIVTNWPIKLTALVLATVLWAVVAAQERTTELVRVTLNVQTPEGRMLTSQLPEVQARYSGTLGELAKLLRNPPTIEKVMPDTLSGSSYFLTLSTTELQTQGADVVPEGVYPDTMTLFLDDVREEQIPVMLSRVSITPDTGYDFVDEITVTPSYVTAIGTDAQLRNIRSITTLPLDTSGIRGRVEIPVPLDTTRLGVGVRIDPVVVQVSANAVQVQRQYLSGVTVVVPRGWESEPAAVSVTVTGPTARIVSFTRDSVTVRAIPDETTDEAYVRLIVDAPPGVSATASSDSVLVKRRNRG
ncbi:MAG: hypothetical protein JSW51_02470 [Gemmatimonadota bacterium]|nr:MAG: hypothetical protein JSW51_02470 [Gemmatimonadota bacterium]